MNGLKNRLLLQGQFQTKRVLIHYWRIAGVI